MAKCIILIVVLEAVLIAVLEAVLGAVLGSFLDPPEPQKLSSRLGAVLVFAKIALHDREPKIDPKMSPKSTPKLTPEGPG